MEEEEGDQVPVVPDAAQGAQGGGRAGQCGLPAEHERERDAQHQIAVCNGAGRHQAAAHALYLCHLDATGQPAAGREPLVEDYEGIGGRRRTALLAARFVRVLSKIPVVRCAGNEYDKALVLLLVLVPQFDQGLPCDPWVPDILGPCAS